MAAAACLSFMLLNSVGAQDQPHREQRSSILPAAAPVSNTPTPVIVINKTNHSFPLAGYGMGIAFGNQQKREEGERYFRRGQYRQAIKAFQVAIESGSRDTRALLGLGNSFVAIGKFEEAISPLSIVRNDCHRSRCAAEKKDEDRYHDGAFKLDERPQGWDRVPNLECLPKQAREALDQEARTALETAVIAIAKKQGFEPDSATPEYKRERHYLALKAALQLAPQFHKTKRIEETAALFRLAQENTRNVPSELIAELNVRGSRSERWAKLARLALNATTPEEKEWYTQELMEASAWLNPTDLRVAAALNFDTVDHVGDNLQVDLSPAADPKTALAEPIIKSDVGGKHKLFFANSKYDNGISSYDTEALDDARKNFEQALKSFQELNRQIDVADTEYNLGCVEYSMGRILAAKRYFKSAAINYRSDKKHRDDENHASYNVAAIAVDGPVLADEEPFLREWDRRFKSIESSTLLGLLLTQLNREGDALEPLAHAAKLSLDSFKRCSAPAPLLNSERNIEVADDRTFTDEEVYEQLFKRFGRVDHYVNSRWSPMNELAPNVVRRGILLSHDSDRNYRGLSEQLYLHALIKCKKTQEIAEWEKLASKGNKEQTRNVVLFETEKQYLNMLRQTIATWWYSPIEESNEHTLVRLWIAEDGQLIVNSIERNEPDTHDENLRAEQERLRQSIGNEALKWASPMPPPPVTLKNREIIVVFDGNKAPEHHGHVLGLPTSGFPLNSPARFRW